MAFEQVAFELISDKTLQISANVGIPLCGANICRVAFCPAVLFLQLLLEIHTIVRL